MPLTLSCMRELSGSLLYCFFVMIDTAAILQQGSQLKADYEVTWDKDGFFWDSRNQAEEKSNRMPLKTARQYRSETSRHEVYSSQLAADHTRRKRFKVKD